MGRMIYLLDTNVVSDILKGHANVRAHLRLNQPHVICVCQPVDYEIRRGLLRRRATTQFRLYETTARSQFQWLHLINDDWRQAAQLWATTVSQGRQLADMDLLIAAVAVRLGAVIVSADDDFDALPVQRVNWREPL